MIPPPDQPHKLVEAIGELAAQVALFIENIDARVTAVQQQVDQVETEFRDHFA